MRRFDGIPRTREEKIDREMNWCAHYNGLVNKTCEAGINYRDVHQGGSLKDTICLGESTLTCPSASFPDYETAARKVDETEAHIREWVRQLESKECPHCHTTYKGKQVGPCVYCEHCNARLYNGRLAERAAQGSSA